jgi:hypothetical protein
MQAKCLAIFTHQYFAAKQVTGAEWLNSALASRGLSD